MLAVAYLAAWAGFSLDGMNEAARLELAVPSKEGFAQAFVKGLAARIGERPWNRVAQ